MKPWTEAHRREAMRWLLMWAHEAAGVCDFLEDGAFEIKPSAVASEDDFIVALNLYEIDPKPALRRVRGLAEGRLVRSTSERWEVQCPHGDAWHAPAGPMAETLARGTARTSGGVPVRRTFRGIRRAP